MRFNCRILFVGLLLGQSILLPAASLRRTISFGGAALKNAFSEDEEDEDTTPSSVTRVSSLKHSIAPIALSLPALIIDAIDACQSCRMPRALFPYVALACGHNVCRSCFWKQATESSGKQLSCPVRDCGRLISDADHAEILNRPIDLFCAAVRANNLALVEQWLEWQRTTSLAGFVTVFDIEVAGYNLASGGVALRWAKGNDRMESLLRQNGFS